ncbi:MAG TPA: HlyD family secretion protein [Gemmataceae bacterium]|nr:HlyD family secretion protein [Gemmataceae bacterium]
MSHDPRPDPAASPAAALSPDTTDNRAITAAPPGSPLPAPGNGSRRHRWLILGLLLGSGLAAAGYFGMPWLVHYFAHESTDDAYVNSYVTYVSPRISGNVTEVLVQDNQFVEPGTVLVRLDAEPFQITVEQRRAALQSAKITVDQQTAALRSAEAELERARNKVRSQVAGLWGSWYMLQSIQNLVRYQEAGLCANQANERLQLANLALAKKEHQRYAELAPRGGASKEVADQKEAGLHIAEEQVRSAQESVKQTRALLGLTADTETPERLQELPETYPGVRYAVSMAQQTLEELGSPTQLLTMGGAAIRAELARLSIPTLMEEVPDVKKAKAGVEQACAALGGASFNPRKPYDHPAVVQAQKDLEQAELNLRYTVLTSPIAGYVNRRSVNPGNQVQPGQTLLALRPLQDVWIDANFKENQLAELRIGQSVDIYVDAYPGRVFHGRVAGFSPGTGAALSLLPPENASGNFVKVVQRLPVRIELTEPPPEDTPLFVGLSVVPEVSIKTPPSGPDAGKRLLSRTIAPRTSKTEPRP